METNASYVAEALPGKSDNSVDSVEKKCVKELEQMLLNGSMLKALSEPEIKGWRAILKDKEANKSALWFCKCLGFLSLIIFHVCVMLHVEGLNEGLIEKDAPLPFFSFLLPMFLALSFLVGGLTLRFFGSYALDKNQKRAEKFFKNFNIDLFSKKKVEDIDSFGALRSLNESLISMNQSEESKVLIEKDLDSVMEGAKAIILGFPIKDVLSGESKFKVTNALGVFDVVIPPLDLNDFIKLDEWNESSSIYVEIREKVKESLNEQFNKCLKDMGELINSFLLLSDDKSESLSKRSKKTKELLTEASIIYFNYHQYLNHEQISKENKEKATVSQLLKKMETDLNSKQYKENLLNKVGKV